VAKILIIDDEPKIRRILGLLLRDQGHQVFEAPDATSGLEALVEQSPDLILLDLSLPDLDGLEVLQRVRARDAETDVIVMTAYGTIRSAVEAIRGGAFDYLPKPFDNEELLLLVARVLQLRRLNAEVQTLRDELEARYGFTEIVGISRPMQQVFAKINKVSRVDATVLITGESGTGKELVARAIHRRSGRADEPFVAVNCGAVPPNLLESEFFGHEKGAFTDAHRAREGRFQAAHGGSLFLDELGELPMDAQTKLLRVIEEKTVTPVGGTRPVPVDVRLIAATNRQLDEDVREKRFREDLYWRINVVHIELPPLRERREDLPLLIDHLFQKLVPTLGAEVTSIELDARELLFDYSWPGNVRELENCLQQAIVLAEGPTIRVADLPPRVRGEVGPMPRPDLDEVPLATAVAEVTERLEKRIIEARLRKFNGNRTQTADSLGVSRKTLFNKLRGYGLQE
jgi:DNA-binding NtrC family response regulator